MLKNYLEKVITCAVKKECIGNIPLFYNHKLLIGAKSVFLKSWFDAGVHYIADLLNADGTFLTLDEFKKTYNVTTNYLVYQGVLNAVKQLLITYNITTNDIVIPPRPTLPPTLKDITINKKGSKAMYNILNNNTSMPTSQAKWLEKPSVTFNKEEWKQIYSLPFNITKDSKLQWFQIRILHRILGTNDLLYKIKYKDSPLCTFCKTENETIEHLFWGCNATRKLITALLTPSIDLFAPLNENTMIFGYINLNNNEIAKNLIIIFLKMYIYKCKMQECPLTVIGAKHIILYYYNINKKAAVVNNNIDNFRRIWESMNVFMPELC